MGEHVAAAFLWLIVGALGLLWAAPQLGPGTYLSPRMVAVAHCFTLGWVTTSMFGLLYQVYPAALAVGCKSERVGHATFWLHQVGTAALVVAAWTWRPWLLVVGWLVMFVAVGCMAWNLLPLRKKAPRGRDVGLYVSAGHTGLGLAMFVIAASIGAFNGWWGLNRFGVLNAHVHLAVGGFALLTAVGLLSTMMPAMLGSTSYPERPLRWIGPLVLGGLTLFAVGQIWRIGVATYAGGLLAGLGVGLHLGVLVHLVRRRTKSLLAGHVLLVAASHALLGGAVGLALVILQSRVTGGSLVVVYGLLGVLGTVTLLMAGLVVVAIDGLAGAPADRNFGAILSVRTAIPPAVVLVLVTGLMTLVVGIHLTSPAAATWGAATFGVGVLALTASCIRLALARAPEGIA